MILSSREKSLIERGYSKEIVEKLCYVSDKDMENIENIIYNDITKDVKISQNPTVTYIGGQPGSGKSVMSMRLKRKSNAVEVGIDNYRMYHPNYLKIEEIIREHWKDRTPSLNDTPGNDIADFTHTFSGMMTDKLVERLTKEKYNILLEWSMRNPNQIINSINIMDSEGYEIILDVLGVGKVVSLEACHLRNSGMSNYSHIVRRVPDNFHELCVNELPNSIGKIYEVCKDKIKCFNIIDRNGNIIWNKEDKRLPNEVLEELINKSYKFDDIKNDIEWVIISFKKESIGLKVSNILNRTMSTINYEDEHKTLAA